jgi:hypothetical protein
MNQMTTIRQTLSAYGRYNRLEIFYFSIIFSIQSNPTHLLLDFFLPRPSLSTTSSPHATWGRSRRPPRRRKVPPGTRSGCTEASRCSLTTTVREPSREMGFDGPPWDTRAMVKVLDGFRKNGDVGCMSRCVVAPDLRFVVGPDHDKLCKAWRWRRMTNHNCSASRGPGTGKTLELSGGQGHPGNEDIPRPTTFIANRKINFFSRDTT